MAGQIDYNDPQYAQSAAEILRRHENGEPEANITSAVRDFLIVTGLVMPDEIVEENPPAQGSRRAAPWASPPSTPSWSSSAGSGLREASTPIPSTSSNSTTTWSSQRSRAVCAWASSPTGGAGCCAGPTPVRSRRPCLTLSHWRMRTAGLPSSSGSATTLFPQR